MILVAGGTGRLGSALVARLTSAGHPVRVLTRDASRAAHLHGVEVVVGDVRQSAGLAAAMRDVTAVISAIHGFAGPGRVSPRSVDRDGNAHLIDAASAVDARFILMSVVGASPDHPLELFRMKAAAEVALRRSDLDWTIARAPAFLDLYVDMLRRSAGRSGRPLVFGRGDNPISFVSVADLADAVVVVLNDPETIRQVIEVAGAEDLTFNQLGARLEPELGSAARRPRHIPRAALRLMALTEPLQPGRLARAALVMDGYAITSARPEAMTPTPPQRRT